MATSECEPMYTYACTLQDNRRFVVFRQPNKKNCSRATTFTFIAIVNAHTSIKPKMCLIPLFPLLLLSLHSTFKQVAQRWNAYNEHEQLAEIESNQSEKKRENQVPKNTLFLSSYNNILYQRCSANVKYRFMVGSTMSVGEKSIDLSRSFSSRSSCLARGAVARHAIVCLSIYSCKYIYLCMYLTMVQHGKMVTHAMLLLLSMVAGKLT